jgi:2-keto-4-pentenoate hydratase/2-oxohepta-3-ene-1,7-dioic acid hydratase in catechol pathway
MNFTVKTKQNTLIPIRNIYCIGRNYHAHAAELNSKVPKQPFFFQKSLPSLNASNKFTIPKNREIHHELEVVILIGKNGEEIPITKTDDYILGYGLGLDLTDREYQNQLKRDQLPWLLSKSFQGSAIVSCFQGEKISEDFWLKINGSIRQKGNINQMIFSISEQISFLSGMLPLLEGDLIFTGTPSGVGPIQNGDDLELGYGKKTIHSLTVK